MRYLDYSLIPMKDGKLSLGNRIQGILKHGFSWPNEMQSQETVMAHLARVLDNRFTLIRNISLADGIVVPLLLVGPSGVMLLNPDPVRGIFRAVNGHWLVSSGQQYIPAKPNLIRRTALFARVAGSTLQELGFSDVEVAGVLVCTNPGVHIELAEPEVRILLVDAIEPFGARMMQAQAVLNSERVYNINLALKRIAVPDEDMGADGDTVAEFRQRQKVHKVSPLDTTLADIDKKLKFSTAQWIILALLLGGTVLILLVFLIYVIAFL